MVGPERVVSILVVLIRQGCWLDDGYIVYDRLYVLFTGQVWDRYELGGEFYYTYWVATHYAVLIGG